MKNGYTTGACAAAGVKAALLFEAGRPWQTVHLTALDGSRQGSHADGGWHLCRGRQVLGR